MSIVVDASVALKWVLDEPGRDAADALLDDELIAPVLWLVEAANALWRRSVLGELTADEARERLFELANAPVASLAVEPHLPAALTLATELAHPVYDCLYLALALHHETHVVTADRRFRDVAETLPKTAGRVRLLVP
ncbi:MAG: type II toxin-antitoxin system VapC family toxin [Proteobacteria bacterium]|nr:type II toxin-antitoxin system VapC family toxin [Pseudomonadota bacterium]